MKNSNKVVVRKLTKRSLISNGKRNFFIIMAITLTAFMITAVFSVGMGMLDSLQAQAIRLEGSKSHAAFPFPTNDQLEQLKMLEYVQIYGTGNYVGEVQNTDQMGDINLIMAYFDDSLLDYFHAPAWTNIVGRYPQKADEIMASQWVLDKIGVNNPEIGMKISLSFVAYGEEDIQTKDFILTGYYTSYDFIRSPQWCFLLVSAELSQQYGKSVENDGSVNILFTNGSFVGQYVQRLEMDMGLTDRQPVVISPAFDIKYSEHTTTIVSLLFMIVFIMFTGYLLIYNVLYISVSRDVRFYGLLKTIGTTPKQIRNIVTGQIMRLCVVGIPIGILLGMLVSLSIVPTIVLSSDIETGVVMSFSPLIFMGTVLFTLITAFVGAASPAKKAAQITAVEAAKYAGEITIKKHKSKNIHGKPYRMALRNIFRDRKRAAVVLLSLFLGVTTFIAITTIVSSMDIDKYADSEYESDFILRNEAFLIQLDGFVDTAHVFDDRFIEKVQDLDGIDELQIFTQAEIEMTYSPEDFDPYIEWRMEKNKGYGVFWPKEDYINNFSGIVYGIDKTALFEVNKTFTEPIDLEAFERGEFALILSDESYLYSHIEDVEVTCMPSKETFVIPLGGCIPTALAKTLSSPYNSISPEFFVSNTFLQQYTNPLAYIVRINVEEGYDSQTFKTLKELIGDNNNISMTSRLEARQVMRDAKMILYMLGGGASVILGLIGIFNFINVMSVGVMVRKREFATMESIGMSKGQLRRMLTAEGFSYALITLVLVALFGNMITFIIYWLLQRQLAFMSFTYPYIYAITIGLLILTVCITAPKVAYRSVNKATIVERLRESE